ncbi:hypothetical protein ESB00_04150 [Oleiharenicola lentus]|uniref:Uncharacterized protein n=1 Tax=Oleiharenicola lentus TaxID=2508720 RepID=A0A4Q1C886_9BACT|nr:hypothetical protein [Oleiharenicola lentus]RXK55098.1 hypothetical protein ESB00_04150 [Oleiharenicola lentus]
MNPETKRSLKKEGKALAAQRSAAWQAALTRANPAPIGSDAWMQNHLRARVNEAWFAEKQRDHISAIEASSRFVLISSEETGQPEPYAECMSCHDLLYSAPKKAVTCTCGSLSVSAGKRPRVSALTEFRAVRLIGKGIA